jgi:hypothetical protein
MISTSANRSGSNAATNLAGRPQSLLLKILSPSRIDTMAEARKTTFCIGQRCTANATRGPDPGACLQTLGAGGPVSGAAGAPLYRGRSARRFLQPGGPRYLRRAGDRPLARSSQPTTASSRAVLMGLQVRREHAPRFRRFVIFSRRITQPNKSGVFQISPPGPNVREDLARQRPVPSAGRCRQTGADRLRRRTGS